MIVIRKYEDKNLTASSSEVVLTPPITHQFTLIFSK